ncbi:leucine-rich repeat-containing protein 28-like [Diadema antillarum]|uniref:leucine-rich repeat-containing protein 28-like n=1 Tax=Diadema antillarum TaxID=105358 RepID=UPI003A8B14EB
MEEVKAKVTTRSASMMDEDQESSSVGDLLIEALHNKAHQILNLNYKGLLEFPHRLTRDDDYTHILVINAKRNLITSLPPNIHRLSGLHTLYLPSNKLSTLPDELCELKYLGSLDISQNAFSQIPPVVCRCISLKRLFLSSNGLSSVPPEIGQLKELVLLNLMNNSLVTLPSEIGQCQSLETLQLDRNRLQSLPQQILALEQLEELSAVGNNFSWLPAGIGWLPRLSKLYVDHNPHLCAVPFNLYSKRVGVSNCGSSKPLLDRQIVQGELCGVLPPEIQTYFDAVHKTEHPSKLLEISLRIVYEYKDILDINSLPRRLASLIEFPTSHCNGPVCCDQPIFTQAYVHLFQIPWVQDYALGGNSNVSLMALCCSRKCLQTLKRHPIPT